MKLDIFLQKRSSNVFVALLENLEVKHTKTYSEKFYNEHAYKNSLYGLSRMLSDYGIENQGVRIKAKEAVLQELEPPFIAYSSNDFIIVTNIDKDEVNYLWKGKKIHIAKDEFIKLWSGIVLLANKNENSGEPDYKEHLKQELLAIIKNCSLWIAFAILAFLMVVRNGAIDSAKMLTVLFANVLGLFITYLLLLKQMQLHNVLGDKICSLLIEKSDCNQISGSDAAKIWGFSWSEIGFAYFMANSLAILLTPSLYIY